MSPTQSAAALHALTKAPRVSIPALRKVFIDVRYVVTLLRSHDVTRVLVAMARCSCVDATLLHSLMDRALAIAPSWQDYDIAPAILAMAHLRVACRPVVEALVRHLWTFEVGKRRHAPKVVNALIALIAKNSYSLNNSCNLLLV